MSEWTNTTRPMSRLAQRFWGGVGERILESGALDDLMTKAGQSADEAARLSDYELRWAYYYNDKLYTKLYRAGRISEAMPVEWNPIPAIVAFYTSTVLAGDITPQPVDEAANAEALQGAVELIWQWSNFDTLRRTMTTTAAVLGDVMLKSVTRMKGDEPIGVYIQDIPPQSVRWWDADERDFLTGIRIDTPRYESVFTGKRWHHVHIEVWRKMWDDGFQGVRYYEAQPNRPLDDRLPDGAVLEVPFSELGYDFIPIVWQRVDTHWRRQLAGIDRFNALAWQMAKINRPLFVVSAGGYDELGIPKAPPLGVSAGLQSFYRNAGNTDDNAIEYQEGGRGVVGVVGMPGASTIAPAGSPIDFGAMNLRMDEVREGVIDALPEYRAATLKGIQIATETLQLLLNQAESRALEMRAGLERALARADMMALTLAQVAGIEPAVFGEGVIGTYESGKTEHVFAPRPVFAKSPMAKAAEFEVLARVAELPGAAAVAGYTDEEQEQLIRSDFVTGVTQ